MTHSRRPPAPPGVPTGARLWLLRQVAAGRVRWLVERSEAWLVGDNASLVTGLFMELVQSRWARVLPSDDAEEQVLTSAETAPTAAGEDVLMEANRKARRR